MNQVRKKVKFDDTLDALADAERRTLLLELLDRTPPEGPPTGIGRDDGGVEVLEHRVSMHHVHLPKLAEYGFVDWDPQNDEVRKGPNFVEIRPLLELLDDHADELPDGWL